MKDHLLNKSKMAKSCGISVQAFDKWFVEGGERVGTSVYYSCADVINNRIANYKDKHQPKEGAELDLGEERARLTHHQANIAELDERVQRGELIPAEIVERVWSDMVASFRAKILSIPTKAAHQFIALNNISEIQDALKEHHNEALLELSEYESTDYGIKVSKDSSE